MAIVGVDDSSIKTDLQLKSTGVVWASAAAWHCLYCKIYRCCRLTNWKFSIAVKMQWL